jgi:hypothetical protein
MNSTARVSKRLAYRSAACSRARHCLENVASVVSLLQFPAFHLQSGKVGQLLDAAYKDQFAGRTQRFYENYWASIQRC